mmetsp:Transcript_175147/g.561704  ORF Transcript_175147/g.561704 Transcript_175147/m.561704 type:complete len:554 (+) Transcript_175147:181-1842(+)
MLRPDLLAPPKLKVESISEVVLNEDESVGHFYIDRTGALGLENEVIRRITTQLVKALNVQFVQATTLQTELDDTSGTLNVVKDQADHQAKALRSVQDSVTDLQIGVGKFSAKMDMFERKLQQDRDTTVLENAVRKAIEELKVQKQTMVEVVTRVETLDKSVRENVKKMAIDLKEMEEANLKHQEGMDEELEQRLREADDTVLSVKLDLEACQASLTENSKTKANRSELDSIKKDLAKTMDSVQKDHATLEEAAGNLARLEECIIMSRDNKARCEEVSRVFRQEASELREWTSRLTAEVRDTLRDKMDRCDAEHQLHELQTKLHESVSVLTESTARAQNGMSQKASLSLVQRLQNTIDDIKPSQSLVKQLLIGSVKCIACDRDIPRDKADFSSLDTYTCRQQEDLYKHVQRALKNQDALMGDHADVLKYVAVRVGSPRREAGKGMGPFEVRQDDDSAPDQGHQLIASRPASRPGGAGGAGLGGYAGGIGGAGGDAAPMPSRSPAREVPPMVRVERRRPNSSGLGVLSAAGGGLLQRDPKGAPSGSIRQALGSAR